MKRTKHYLGLIKKQNNCYSAQIKAKDLFYFHEAYFSKHINTFYSHKEINKYGFFKFGSNIPHLLKFNKKPNAEYKFAELDVKTFYYKQKISGKKAYCEFSYYKGKLFHFSYCFKYLSERDKTEIANILTKKYLNDELHSPDFKIIDKYGDFVAINNSMCLTVSYFENNSELIYRLKEIQSDKENSLNKKEAKVKLELHRIL